MLRRDSGQSVSFCDGFRNRDYFHMGRGLLPFLALMLLAAPQAAFGQERLAVTLSKTSLIGGDGEGIDEGGTETYTVKLNAAPSADVVMTIVENSDAISVAGPDSTNPTTLTFTTDNFADEQTVTVTAAQDDNAVDEKVTITHTATVGGKPATLRVSDVSVSVTVDDDEETGVTVSVQTLTVDEAGTGNYTVVLTSEPTDTVTIDVGGTSGEVTVSPSRLVFTPGVASDALGHWQTAQTVNVFAGEDFDNVNDSATLTHTVRGGDYAVESANSVAVTVTDDDTTRSVIVTPTTVRVATGLSESYTVVLGSQPEATVTISVSETSDNLSVSSTSLTFSRSNWNSPKTVRVSARSGLTSDDSVTLTQAIVTTSSGRDTAWDSVTVDDVTVNIASARTSVSLSSSSVTVREGATATYRVRLRSEPAGTTTVTIGIPTGADVTASVPTLSFSPTDSETLWNKWQEVTLTGVADADAVRETFAVTHQVGSEAYATLRVTVTENDTKGVTLSESSLEVLEGGSSQYSVLLDSQPTGAVTVSVGGASGDVTVNPAQLTFSTTNWSTAQVVTVNAAADKDGQTDPAVTLTHRVRGADYDGLGAGTVRVTITETGKPGITVSPTSLPLTEGATGSYTVKLDSEPTATVTVTVQGQSGDVTVKPSRLLFTTSNWNIPQEVEVKAGEDGDAETDPVVTLTHAASGGDYNGVTGGRVTVTITDDDVAIKGVTVAPTRLDLVEGSPPRTYTVVLRTQPTGTVTFTVGGLTPAHAQSLRVSPTVLTFNSSDWNIPKVVTVTALEDDDGNDVSQFDLTHAVSGGGYVHRLNADGTTDTANSNITVDPVSVSVTDNDTIGLTVTPTAMEIVAGKRETYSVVLDTRPTANVTVTVVGTGITASPGSLTFTQSNWNREQTVFLRAAADASTGTATVANTPADGGYGAGQAVTVNVAIKSTGEAGIAVNPTSLSVTEGESASYTVVLSREPTATVHIDISGASGALSLSRSRLTFATSNYDREQTVTVRLAADDDAEPEPAVDLVHEVSGASEYASLTPGPVRVTPKETDTRGVMVTPTSLTVAAGQSGTYTVQLNSQPVSDVTVTVASDDSGVTVDPPSLIFDSSNWNRAQTATVSVAADAGAETVRTVTLSHSVSGGRYAGEDPPNVIVTIPVEGAPGPPTGLTAQAGNQIATLTWGAPANDGGSAILRYEVRYQEVGGNYNEWATVSGGAGATSTVVRGLENGKSYEFQVRARNATAAGQPATATVELGESAPGAPPNLTATGGDGQVTLSWGESAGGGSEILRYEYRYAEYGGTWSEWTTASGAGNARGVTIDGLTNGTLYGFEVRAVNSVGEGEASQETATPGRAPSAPTGLTARVESETITVMWGMPADTGGAAITRYEVRYRMNGNSWSNWFTIAGGANATSYTMDGLTNGIGHEIQVRAVNAIGSGAAASVEATPMEGIDFAHFANGTAGGVTITSDIVLVNVETSAVTPAIYFYNQMGDMIDADSVVDVTGDLMVNGDGVLTVPMGIPGRGEMTISTNGEGALVVGSVRVFGTGRLGGVLRFDIPDVGVAGVGASEPVSDAIFPARRMVGGINTGAAIRNLGAESMTVTCMLMQDGDVMDTVLVVLDGDGHSAQFIDEMFPGANTADFVGSVRCTAANGGMFVGVALEMDAANGIFTTLPVVPLGTGARYGESTLNFAHFANGDFGGTATSSDLVFVNVASSAVSPAVYFYDQMGNMIDVSMVVDAMMEGVEVADGVLMVMDEIPSLGEMTISTSGMGAGMVGSVRVVSDGPIGGVLRFDIPNIGVAGVGASKAVNDAIFPARRMTGGINTGAAIRNLMADMTSVTCRLMMGGQRLGETVIDLAGNGQNSQFINEMFANANTDDFTGSVHCTAPSGSMFTGVALEMDFNNRIFTTLPVVPVR